MRHGFARLGVAGAVVLALAIGAHAQLFQTQANIPFPFVAGDKQFAAGMCTISRPERTGNASTLILRSGKTSTAVSALPVIKPGSTWLKPVNQLSFHRYGEKYFLAEVWINSGGSQLLMSAEEKAAQKEGAEMKLVTLNIKQ